MRWTDMSLRTVLTIAAIVACLRPAVAMVTNLPLQPVDVQTTQTPPQGFGRDNGGSLRGARPGPDPRPSAFHPRGKRHGRHRARSRQQRRPRGLEFAPADRVRALQYLPANGRFRRSAFRAA